MAKQWTRRISPRRLQQLLDRLNADDPKRGLHIVPEDDGLNVYPQNVFSMRVEGGVFDETELGVHIGRVLEWRRRDLGLSRIDMALMLGTTPARYLDLERRGASSSTGVFSLTMMELRYLLAFLDLDLHRLVNLIGPMDDDEQHTFDRHLMRWLANSSETARDDLAYRALGDALVSFHMPTERFEATRERASGRQCATCGEVRPNRIEPVAARPSADVSDDTEA